MGLIDFITFGRERKRLEMGLEYKENKKEPQETTVITYMIDEVEYTEITTWWYRWNRSLKFWMRASGSTNNIPTVLLNPVPTFEKREDPYNALNIGKNRRK